MKAGIYIMENNDYEKQNEIFSKGLTALILSCVVSIVGLILAIINKKNIKAYLAQGGTLYGKGKTGQILTNIGFGVALAEIIIVGIYVVVYVLFIGIILAGAR